MGRCRRRRSMNKPPAGPLAGGSRWSCTPLPPTMFVEVARARAAAPTSSTSWATGNTHGRAIRKEEEWWEGSSVGRARMYREGVANRPHSHADALGGTVVGIPSGVQWCVHLRFAPPPPHMPFPAPHAIAHPSRFLCAINKEVWCTSEGLGGGDGELAHAGESVIFMVWSNARDKKWSHWALTLTVAQCWAPRTSPAPF